MPPVESSTWVAIGWRELPKSIGPISEREASMAAEVGRRVKSPPAALRNPGLPVTGWSFSNLPPFRDWTWVPTALNRLYWPWLE